MLPIWSFKQEYRSHPTVGTETRDRVAGQTKDCNRDCSSKQDGEKGRFCTTAKN
ncbi:Hypothetical predicted protein [Podarcis lilfordi]|uniref:Uncharacterized protein n=1 Tax=Podarcis lilfordi TaxID=74358 RepID=A0AA35JSH5_9SAUR|nr:Hypothetical predicted protein [Podarcis lilfordi]